MSDPDAAERINQECFELSRQIAQLACTVPEAAPLARILLRITGRLVIDAAGPGAEPGAWPNTEATALKWLNEALGPLGYQVAPVPGSGRPPVLEPADEWR